MAEFCSETARKFWNTCWPKTIYIVGRKTYEGLKISINSIIETTQFLLWHQVKGVLKECFCQDLLENWFGRIGLIFRIEERYPSMAYFRYNKPKHSNQSLMVMFLIVAWLPQLTNHFHIENLRKNESLNVKSWIKNSSLAASLKLKQNTS